MAAPKKNGKIRWCVDYQPLNKSTIKDTHPIGSIQENLSYLANSRIFSVVDGAGAYHVIPLRESDRQLTAFATPMGSYHFKRLPFGLSNAPATYARLVNMVLSGIPYDVALPYLDDIIIHTRRRAQVLRFFPFCTFDYRRFCGDLFDRTGADFVRARITGAGAGRVETTEGAFEAPVVVDAAGWRTAAPRDRRRAARAPRKSFGIEARQPFRGEGLHFYVGGGRRQRRFYWVFPAGDHVRAGLATYSGESALSSELDEFLADLDLGEPGHAHGGYFTSRLSEPIRDSAFVVGEDRVDDPVRRPRLDLVVALGTARRAEPRPAQPQEVHHLGERSDRRTSRVARRLLVDRHRRGQPLDLVDLGLLHAAEELTSVRAEALEEPALPLLVDRVVGEARLARPRDPRERRQGVPRELEVDVLQVVLPRTPNHDLWGRGRARARLAAALAGGARGAPAGGLLGVCGQVANPSP